jgi:hypothetical protein
MIDGRPRPARTTPRSRSRPELPLQPIIAGRWHDRLERDDDGWHIVERVIYADLTGDLRFHIKGLR